MGKYALYNYQKSPTMRGMNHMSASREKKNRQNKPEVTPAEAPKKGMSKGAKRALAIVIAIVLVAAIAFLGMVTSGFFEKHTTAAVANGHKLSPAMLNYYYVSGYQEVQSYFGGVMDTEIPLSEQEYSGEGFDTWGDYFMDYAASIAANTYAIYDEAVANGYTLTENGQATIDSELEMLDLYASAYGYPSGDSLLSSQYGIGCNKKNYEEYLTVTMTATEYANNYIEELSYTDAEIAAYYEENSDNFDAATYRYYAITPGTLGLEDGEESLKACEEAAKAMAEAAQGNEQAFLDQVADYVSEDVAETYDPDSATIREDYTYNSYGDFYYDWLTDEARQEGDATYVANGDSGYAVLYFIRHEDHSFQMPNVRHILISAADTTDEEAMATAAQQAEDILDEYLAGEQTEEAFAELARTYSVDNADEGGLYENIAPGQMVESFDAWCYDESRQVGDTDIVETEYGYHIMYFSGYGESYQDYMVENALRNADYQAWNSEITADVSYTVNESASRYMIKL